MNSDPLPNDHLDPLLRKWHDQNSARARELRDQTLARIANEPRTAGRVRGGASWFGRGLAAAAALVLVVTGAYLLPIFPTQEAAACVISMVPDGGRLTACDRTGQTLGACPLQHTDVAVDIAGPFTRVTLVQKFANPYRVPIEAVYTFPLGERSAVDRMRMTVRGPGGERIVDGVVKERNLARFMYEAAREQGYVASLLEQERPNIFTQSVANIEPGATVDVEISYIETLAMKDGVYQFAFPMVVGPRYIPGQATNTTPVPAGWTHRNGVILLGPASFAKSQPLNIILDPAGSPQVTTSIQAPPAGAELAALATQVENATPVGSPDEQQRTALGQPTVAFTVTYADGSQEPGALYASGAGSVGNRWFIVDVNNSPAGNGFAPNTTKVPDASRITPMPVRPSARAGHDISMRVNIDTGGPGLKDLVSKMHGVDVKFTGNNKCALQLQGGSTIPNKDFVLTWGLQGNSVLEGAFTYAVVPPATPPQDGVLTLGAPPQGYFTLVMTPPAVVAAAQALPRELVFVLDTSGSMNGIPIEKSKELMKKVLAAMRPEDTFNIVTFAGATAIMWPELRPASPANVELAQKFVGGLYGSGGTEMMKAIDAALVQMPGTAPIVQPDGTVTVPPRTPISPPGADLESGVVTQRAAPGDTLTPGDAQSPGARKPAPMRIAVFLTDGYVGNDQSILAAVQKNAGTTRVFTFGIGNSINRYLLEEMAHQGRGACDIVLTSDSADKAVDLFTRRIQTPVLQNISVAFEGVEASDMQPSGGLIPDLWDMQPLVIHGRWATPGTGSVVVRGTTAQGPYERRIPIKFDVNDQRASMLPQLWARRKVDTILAPHLQAVEQQTLAANIRAEVVQLGEAFHLVTPYTSFVAIERSRVIVGGRPMLVTVPIEFPDSLRWEGFFGGDSWCNQTVAAAVWTAEGHADAVERSVKWGEVAQNPAENGFALNYNHFAEGYADKLEDDLHSQLAEAEGRPASKSAGSQSVAGRSAGWRDVSGTDRFDRGVTELKSLGESTAGYRIRGGTTEGARVAGGAGGGPASGGTASRGLGLAGGGLSAGVRVKGTEFAAPSTGSPGGAPPMRRPPPVAPVASPTFKPGEPATTPAAPAAPTEQAPPPPPPPAPAPAAPAPALDASDAKLKDAARKAADEPANEVSEKKVGAIYLVQSGDTLSAISQVQYGTADQWKVILDANSALLNGNEKALQPGMHLVIPPLVPGQSAGVPAGAPVDQVVAQDPKIASTAIPEDVRNLLARVLERRLLALALYERLTPEQCTKLPELPAEITALMLPAIAAQPRTVQVNVLVAEDSKELRGTLAELGLTVTADTSAPAGKRILIGAAPVGGLIGLAQAKGVLRIEPLQAEAER